MARVSIDQGELQGKCESTLSGKTFYSFKGIPYGRSTHGDRRFKAPLPAGNWIGLRDATEHGPPSPHRSWLANGRLEGSEDCLSLNVYTPDPKGCPLPVMVWFHGGGFRDGSGDSFLFGPDYFLDENVVLVTVNYRLEALGFLCLETEEAPGNAGMKDQVLSLKWVRDNIAQFAGDPLNVTIFGESAGAISVTYHLVSPMSQGLFHRVIAQSGTFLNEWGFSVDTIDHAFAVGKHLGKDTKDKKELIDFLKSVPSSKLISITTAIAKKRDKLKSLNLYFCPCVEKQIDGQESFLPKAPLELLQEGNFVKVPIIIGYNNAESLYSLGEFMKKSEKIENDFATRVPRDICRSAPQKLVEILANQIKQFYYADKSISEETIKKSIEIESDITFVFGIQKFAKIMAQLSQYPVYFYRFSVDGRLNIVKSLSGYPQIKGASHADDIFYMFKIWTPIQTGSDEWKTMKRMTRMWTNFAAYGNPTPFTDELIPMKWKPIAQDKLNFLEIDFELKLGEDPDRERYEFWEKIHESVDEFRKLKSSL